MTSQTSIRQQKSAPTTEVTSDRSFHNICFRSDPATNFLHWWKSLFWKKVLMIQPCWPCKGVLKHTQSSLVFSFSRRNELPTALKANRKLNIQPNLPYKNFFLHWSNLVLSTEHSPNRRSVHAHWKMCLNSTVLSRKPQGTDSQWVPVRQVRRGNSKSTFCSKSTKENNVVQK